MVSDDPGARARDFASLPLKDSLRTVLAELGFTTPTPVQADAIPLLLAGRDLIGSPRPAAGRPRRSACPSCRP